MKISKSISALILSLVLVLGSFGTAHAKRLTAAVADWTGGEITCQVAVSMPVSYTHLTLPTSHLV